MFGSVGTNGAQKVADVSISCLKVQVSFVGYCYWRG